MNTLLYGPSGLRWLMLVGWMIVIFAFSSQPNSSQVTEHVFGPLNLTARKLAHVSEYAILFFLGYRAFVTVLRKRAHVYAAAFAVSVLYACSDEWHQMFVPGRSASMGDVAIDTIGVFLACVALYLVQKR